MALNRFEVNEIQFGKRRPIELDEDLGFGKHSKRTFRQVVNNDFEYAQWLNEEGCPFSNEAYEYFSKMGAG